MSGTIRCLGATCGRTWHVDNEAAERVIVQNHLHLSPGHLTETTWERVRPGAVPTPLRIPEGTTELRSGRA